MDGRGRSSLQPPNVSDYPPARSTLPPPFTLVSQHVKLEQLNEAFADMKAGNVARGVIMFD